MWPTKLELLTDWPLAERLCWSLQQSPCTAVQLPVLPRNTVLPHLLKQANNTVRARVYLKHTVGDLGTNRGHLMTLMSLWPNLLWALLVSSYLEDLSQVSFPFSNQANLDSSTGYSESQGESPSTVSNTLKLSVYAAGPPCESPYKTRD